MSERKIYNVDLTFSASRRFYVRASSPEEAQAWAEENLSDYSAFEEQDSYIECNQVGEADSEEVEEIFETSDDWTDYEPESEFDDSDPDDVDDLERYSGPMPRSEE